MAPNKRRAGSGTAWLVAFLVDHYRRTRFSEPDRQWITTDEILRRSIVERDRGIMVHSRISDARLDLAWEGLGVEHAVIRVLGEAVHAYRVVETPLPSDR